MLTALAHGLNTSPLCECSRTHFANCHSIRRKSTEATTELCSCIFQLNFKHRALCLAQKWAAPTLSGSSSDDESKPVFEVANCKPFCFFGTPFRVWPTFGASIKGWSSTRSSGKFPLGKTAPELLLWDLEKQPSEPTKFWNGAFRKAGTWAPGWQVAPWDAPWQKKCPRKASSKIVSSAQFSKVTTTWDSTPQLLHFFWQIWARSKTEKKKHLGVFFESQVFQGSTGPKGGVSELLHLVCIDGQQLEAHLNVVPDQENLVQNRSKSKRFFSDQPGVSRFFSLNMSKFFSSTLKQVKSFQLATTESPNNKGGSRLSATEPGATLDTLVLAGGVPAKAQPAATAGLVLRWRKEMIKLCI